MVNKHLKRWLTLGHVRLSIWLWIWVQVMISGVWDQVPTPRARACCWVWSLLGVPSLSVSAPPLLALTVSKKKKKKRGWMESEFVDWSLLRVCRQGGVAFYAERSLKCQNGKTLLWVTNTHLLAPLVLLHMGSLWKLWKIKVSTKKEKKITYEPIRQM